jgi:hypothetical protein
MTKHAKYSSPTVQAEVGKCYGMEMNVENTKTTIPSTDYDTSKATRECKIF